MPPRRSTTDADEAAGCGIRHGWQSGDRQYAAPAGEYRPQIGQCLLIPGCGGLPPAETPLSCRNERRTPGKGPPFRCPDAGFPAAGLFHLPGGSRAEQVVHAVNFARGFDLLDLLLHGAVVDRVVLDRADYAQRYRVEGYFIAASIECSVVSRSWASCVSTSSSV